MDRGTTINIESPKTMGGGESTTGRRDMVEIRRANGGQGNKKTAEGRGKKKEAEGGGGERSDAKGVRVLRRNEKRKGEG
jgi:hypothetical protein